MNVRLFFKWFDFWIGVYIDTENRAVCICPVPMLGVRIGLGRNREPKPKREKVIRTRMTAADATRSFTHSIPCPTTDPPTEKGKP